MRFQSIPIEDRQEFQPLCRRDGRHESYPGDCICCAFLRYNMESPVSTYSKGEKEYISTMDPKTNKIFLIIDIDPFFQEAV